MDWHENRRFSRNDTPLLRGEQQKQVRLHQDI